MELPEITSTLFKQYWYTKYQNKHGVWHEKEELDHVFALYLAVDLNRPSGLRWILLSRWIASKAHSWTRPSRWIGVLCTSAPVSDSTVTCVLMDRWISIYSASRWITVLYSATTATCVSNSRWISICSTSRWISDLCAATSVSASRWISSCAATCASASRWISSLICSTRWQNAGRWMMCTFTNTNSWRHKDRWMLNICIVARTFSRCNYFSSVICNITTFLHTDIFFFVFLKNCHTVISKLSSSIFFSFPHTKIPTSAAVYHRYWSQKFCPAHEHDSTAPRCSFERLQNYPLEDERSLCLQCMEPAIMDTDGY
ncbi:hypothetical protein SADUNF_Sadunf10G0151700 [Salix dunnii]|uniref:Uncharacterized protein n=1 Tax=Salix dunnii TaxID=1413687 RepID=A0A835MV78_9ROSI|nr:hypothetical protein SADUNF_Sadunf10G0151700 [Salix dunnii]